ncbi:MAG: type II secretion system protein GspM [Gammaproteobacteria bacterium]|nr:type II secretion system protein GspM [Gammaproteobacteria bacterium]MDH5799965.1 type II secretion system protein GspM [Gammaproteobacteria bacterium]
MAKLSVPGDAGQRKFLAMALLGMFLSAVYLLLVYPMQEQYTELEQRHARLLQQLVRYDQALAMRESYLEQINTLNTDKALLEYFLEESTAELASASLQQKIKQIIQKNEARLNSSQMLVSNATAKQALSLYPVTLKVVMKADMRAMQRIFYELVNARPVLFVHDVNIKSHGNRRFLQTTDGTQMLDVVFQLTAYMRPPMPQGKEES